MRAYPILLLLALLAPPLASAGHAALYMEAAAPAERLAPGGAPVRLPVTLVVACHGNGTLPSATAHFRVLDKPAWADAAFEPADVEVPATACGEGASRVPAVLAVNVTTEAPAFRPTPLRFEASLALGEHAHSVTQEVALEAGYHHALRAELDLEEAVGEPQSVLVFPLRIINDGNAMTRVGFEVVDKPADFMFVMPQPLVLQSRQQGGAITELTVPLTVMTPYRNGWLNETGEVTIRVRAFPVEHPELAREYEVTLRPGVKGFYVPGPGLATAALAVVGAALLARALRR